MSRLAVDRNLALGGRLEAADDVQERGLAAAGGTHDGDELILVDVEVDAVQGNHLTLASLELLHHMVDVDLYC